jgi:hypothetical protein
MSQTQSLLSTYANQSYVQASNTTIWSAINLKESIANVQSLLSTYLNLTMFQASNNTQDTRLDALENTNVTLVTNLLNSNTTQATAISTKATIGNTGEVKVNYLTNITNKPCVTISLGGYNSWSLSAASMNQWDYAYNAYGQGFFFYNFTGTETINFTVRAIKAVGTTNNATVYALRDFNNTQIMNVSQTTNNTIEFVSTTTILSRPLGLRNIKVSFYSRNTGQNTYLGSTVRICPTT